MAREKLQVVLELVSNQFKSEVRSSSSALGPFRRNLEQSGKSTSTLEQGMGRVGRVAKLAIAGVAVGAVAGMTRELAMSVKAFADFDQKMTESLAIMGNVSQTMRGEMSDAAREVGRTTLFSATEAAEAYFFLASAGLDAAASVEAMPQVAKFAQAGMFDLATATDLATDAQSALGLKSSNARQNLENLTRVTDVFVRANTLANTSVQQISEAMTTKAGAALRALGKDVEEGSAVLAAFADQGVKGAEAGTQFSIVLRDLQTKALDNKKAFAEAGVAVFDASGEMRNMADIIGDLERALEGMSDAEKKSTLLGLGFSDKSVSAITTLLGTSDAIRQYETSLRSAAGFTEDVANKQLESLTGQFELLSSKVADARLELGQEVAPAFADLIPQLETLIELATTLATTMGPTLAQGLEFGFRAVEGTIEAVLRALELLGNSDAGAAADLIEVMSAIRRDAVPGATNVDKLANALAGLATRGSLTKGNIQAVAKALGATDEELLRVIPLIEDFDDSLGDNRSELDRWRDVLEGSVNPAIYESGEATSSWRNDLAELETELNAAAHAGEFAASEAIRFKDAADLAGGAAGGAGAAAGAGADGMGEFGDEVAESADDAQDLATALERAALAQESLANQILRFTNPVFNAISAIGSLQTAEANLDKVRQDRDATARELAQAEIEVTQKTIEAQAALDGLSPDGIEGLALAWDGSRERLDEILETLGIITNGRWTTILDIEARLLGMERAKQILASEDLKFGDPDESTRVPDPGNPISPEDALAPISGAQHQGGFVEAGSRQHVLANEVFVPSRSGMILPDSGGSTPVVMNNYFTLDASRADFADTAIRQIDQKLQRFRSGGR